MDFARFIGHGEWLFFTKEYDIVNMIILFKNFLVGYDGVYMCLINWYYFVICNQVLSSMLYIYISNKKQEDLQVDWHGTWYAKVW